MAIGAAAAKREIIRVERRERVLALRKAGVHSYRKIAEQLQREGYKCTWVTARQDFFDALRERKSRNPEEIEELAGVQQERIEAMVLALWQTAMNPPLINVRDKMGHLVYDNGEIAKEPDHKAQQGAVEKIAKLMAQQAELFGLNFLDRVKAEAQMHNAETYALLEKVLISTLKAQSEEFATTVEEKFNAQLLLASGRNPASMGNRASAADSAIDGEFHQIG